jgi:hypothetical protein
MSLGALHFSKGGTFNKDKKKFKKKSLFKWCKKIHEHIITLSTHDTFDLHRKLSKFPPKNSPRSCLQLTPLILPTVWRNQCYFPNLHESHFQICVVVQVQSYIDSVYCKYVYRFVFFNIFCFQVDYTLF